MATSEIINPNFEEKITNALKADRIVHRVTFNPNKASPGETLYIPVPKLNDEVVLVPGSLAVIFDSEQCFKSFGKKTNGEICG